MSIVEIQPALEDRLGGRWAVRSLKVSGFCATWHAHGHNQELFLKSLPAGQAHVLIAEADGLRALAATQTIRVPAVVDCWIDAKHNAAVLALEYLTFARSDGSFGARFGAALASLHSASVEGSHGSFGWHCDNMLGATPQTNAWTSGEGLTAWIEFLRCRRLGYMRQRLCEHGAPAALLEAVDAVSESLPELFADGYEPCRSLIHGDLWSGNWGMLRDGTPVIYDPAVSCSDAEAELAMMELFGAVPEGFWSAYRQRRPIAPGYASRRGLYQLYHLLNHALLFGGSYAQQALSVALSLRR